MVTHRTQGSQCFLPKEITTSMKLSKRVTSTGTPNCKIEMSVISGRARNSKSQSGILQSSFSSNNKLSRGESRTCRQMLMNTITFSLRFKKQTPSSMSNSDQTTIDDSSSTMFSTHRCSGRTSNVRSGSPEESEQL